MVKLIIKIKKTFIIQHEKADFQKIGMMYATCSHNARCCGWFSGRCNSVDRVCWVFLARCNAVSKVFWRILACCNVDAKMIWMFVCFLKYACMLLPGCYGWLSAHLFVVKLKGCFTQKWQCFHHCVYIFLSFLLHNTE